MILGTLGKCARNSEPVEVIVTDVSRDETATKVGDVITARCPFKRDRLHKGDSVMALEFTGGWQIVGIEPKA